MMKTISPTVHCTEVMPAEGYCSYDDIDNGLIYSRLEHLAKDQEQLGCDAISVQLLLTAVAVVGAHAKTYGNRVCFGLDTGILKKLETSHDELLPALLAMHSAGCISTKSTGDGSWAFLKLSSRVAYPIEAVEAFERESLRKSTSEKA
jgi:hypothetical protein